MKCSPKTMLKIGLVLATLLGGGFLIFPQLRPAIASLAPLAIIAICPLSMIFMASAMNKNQGHSDSCTSCGHQHEKSTQKNT